MPETDAVKSFGHHKWGGDIRDVNVSLSINRNSGVDVAGVLSTTIRIYPSIPFSLVEQGENVQKKLSASFGKVAAYKEAMKGSNILSARPTKNC